MERIDVSALLLGIDATARAEVQAAMNELAARGDTATNEGLVQMLREAIALLRGVERAWTHAGAQSFSPMPAPEAEARFVELTQRARARFEHELIRNADGSVTEKAAPPLPASDEPGVVVVTVVVAARRELADVQDVRDREQLALAFDALAAIEPKDFVAMEVIWSPADERDRASAAMVEAKYPELSRLAPALA